MRRGLQSIALSSGLALGLALTYGLGVLALPLILPAMMIDLGWGFQHAGFLASAAPAGLAAGLALTAAALPRISAARTLQLGLVVATAALIATGATRDVYALAVLRFICGLATAPVILCGGVLASAIARFEVDRAPTMRAIFRGGTGAGVVACGLIVPGLLHSLGVKGWPEAWLTLGLVASVVMPFVFWASQRIVVLPQRAAPAHWPWRRFIAALCAFGLFSAGLHALLTFLVLHAHLRGAGPVGITAIWTTLGLAGVLSPFFWQPAFAVLASSRQLASTIGLTALGALLILIGGPPSILVVPAALLGFGGFMVHVSLARLLQSALTRETWPRAHSALLVLGAAAQTVGAMVAGTLATHTGTTTATIAASSACLAVAAGVALLQAPTVTRAPLAPPSHRPQTRAHPAQPS